MIERREVARVAFVVLAAIAVWFRVWEPFAGWSAIGVGATLVGGYPIFKEAFENIRERRMTMELSMTIALLAALAIGQAFTALVITAFVLAAEILEHLTVARGRIAIGELLQYLPQTALVRRAGEAVEVPVASLSTGDVVLVKPGALIPVDGSVRAGHSFVDQARITGESVPVEKALGAMAYAGTLNQNGALDIRVERIGRDTSFGRIIDAIETAERSRAPVERLADRLSGYLVYFALGSALLTYLVTRNIVATISVVIVAGACGIAAGTPLAILGAIGRAAQAGAIVKGGRYIEALAATTVVVFDKTGTVTCGRPEVQRVEPEPGVSPQMVLAVAALAEIRSEHPLGRAIVEAARARHLPTSEPETFDYTPGRGVSALAGGETVVAGSAVFLRERGFTIPVEDAQAGAGSPVFVAEGTRLLGTLRVADALRPEAIEAIGRLRALKIRTVLLTGDVHTVAARVAADLGVDELFADALPEEKRAYIERLVERGDIVAMVGDGINDAPALVAASVGVAMGSGTDVARESADVVLLGNDLLRFVDTLEIARRTKTIVMQNFAGTLAVDAAGILLAAGGWLHPLGAASVHVLSELAFILNSTRMLAPRKRPAARRATGPEVSA